jgi:serine/threonine protein kinase
MSTKILRKGLSTLLNSSIIEILADVPGASKAIDLLKENFTFTAAEIAKNFQESYGYALAAIGSGLVPLENQRGFWQSLFQKNVESEFSQRLEQDYLLPFARQQGLSDEKLFAFRKYAVAQCQQMATFTLFQAENVPFSEKELASFVSESEAGSMTDLVLELVQTQETLDERVMALLQFKELLGNALFFFLYEQLRKEPRFQTTLAALQRDGLIMDVREIKNIVQSTENKLNQALTKKQFGEVAQLGQQLERLQKVESVTQTHYAQFLDFSQRFADWAQLVNIQLEQVLAAMPKLQERLVKIEDNTEQILSILQQLMARADLSPQVKPRDELTQYNPASLELIGKARQLLKRIPSSDPQYSRVAIGLGSVVSSQGDLKQAEALFTKAYQQASNDNERALSAFNLFQVFTRQQVYEQALFYLQEAIKLNPQRYALHNVHTYSIKQILGAGGMGCAFLAHHRLKKELVVVKCFWETLHGSADALFKEAFLMSEIAGEYIPQPLDCGFVDIARQERGYFISEYIEGAIDGEAWLKEHGKLDVPTGIAVGLQIAKGLQIAHEKGIFHLDLKPANILLRKNADEIMVKIIDFGLAKVAPSLGQEMATQRSHSGLSLLAQAAVFGTMDYAPPEQQGVTRYGEPNAKSDVYAFGKTLYRLLTGESPHTFHPRRLANAPELFELLCDCVELDPERRVDVAGLMKRLNGSISQISQPPKPIKQSPKPIEKPIQPEQPRIVKIDNKNRQWWNQLDDNWKKVFKKAIGVGFFKGIFGLDDLDNNDLEQIFSLQGLKCWNNQLSDLEPLRALTKLQTLVFHGNQLSDLEPLRALTNLQELGCWENQLSDLEPLRALTNLQKLHCSHNKLNDLEPLHALTKLQELDCSYNKISNLEALRALTKLQKLWCSGNQISDLELDNFKKAVPNCTVYS